MEGINKAFNFEDFRKFGRLLSSFRTKSINALASALSLSNSYIRKWEDGTILPDESRLPDIIRAYGIEEEKKKEELIKAFNISKDAREKEAKFRHDLKYPKKNKPKHNL
ncbi:MAG TPA: helix-turn-helix domain-containing protein [Candidatus Paceibacterota bacterium]|nr:helix-turn-helix domain-containing protein [Candidatus Paceibacterota bacterium]